jgi:hypothetical protein
MLLVVLAVVLVVLGALLVCLISLRMTYRMVDRLTELSYPGSFKGPWDVELKASSEPASPEPLKPKRWVRRKPPPNS